MTEKRRKNAGIETLMDLRGRCVIDDITKCWKWSGYAQDGLPSVWFKHPATGKIVKAQGRRAALILKTGFDLESGMRAIRLPICERTDCCNPDHTMSGDAKAFGKSLMETGVFKNSVKRIASNRANARKTRKLTDEQIAEIRSDERSTIALGRIYGVCSNTINDIKRGVRYRQTFVGASIFSFGNVQMRKEAA